VRPFLVAGESSRKHSGDEEVLGVKKEKGGAKENQDKGINGEPTAMYDSDMAVYLHEMRNAPPEKLAILKKNLEWNRARAAEGK